jgi:hypothetical protein
MKYAMCEGARERDVNYTCIHILSIFLPHCCFFHQFVILYFLGVCVLARRKGEEGKKLLFSDKKSFLKKTYV